MGALARFVARFRAEQAALSSSFRDLPVPADASRHAALLLHKQMFRRFLQEAGFARLPVPEKAATDSLFDEFRWSLDDPPPNDALTPDLFGCLFDKHVGQKETGTFYTGRDISDTIARSTIIPAFLDAVSARCPEFCGRARIAENTDLIEVASAAIGRCRAHRPARGLAGTREVDRPRPDLRLRRVPGCGAACPGGPLQSLPRTDAVTAGRRFATILARADRQPGLCSFVRASILRQNLFGLDLMPEAVEITRMRLLLMLAAASRGATRLPAALHLRDHLTSGDVLAACGPFPQVARRGGFSVIVGNPPYVELGDDPRLAGYHTAACGNIYAPIVERSLGLLAPKGRLGMIVPHSAFCTDRMAPLASLITEGATTWISTYDMRPCKLFAGVDQRLAIFLRHESPETRIFSTRYHRWLEAERPSLFARLRYLEVSDLRYENSVPKAGDPIEKRIWKKIHGRAPLQDDLGGESAVYYHNAPRYWVRAMTFAPYFWNERDGEKLSVQVKTLSVKSETDAQAVAALLNSNLFYWWWVLLSDCRHLNRREIDRFPTGLAAMGRGCKRDLGVLCRRLMADYRRHAVRKECRYRTTGQVIYDEFYPGRSKPILDDIDRVLAGHYGLTDTERDFFINHDLKYRLGAEPAL